MRPIAVAAADHFGALAERRRRRLPPSLDFAEMMLLSVLSAKDDMRERRLGHCRLKGHQAPLILN